jgi:endonuclease-3
MSDEWAATILETLRESLSTPKLVELPADPFQTLIITIISQNTANTNTQRAFENLSKKFEVTPKGLAESETSRVEACLHVAGLSRVKTKTIQNVAKIVVESFGGSLASVLSLPFNEARKTLLRLPGVGPKTADVVLLFSANQPTIPVDTHVNRVAKRLGIAPKHGSYEVVRLSIQSFFLPKDYMDVHLLLITQGKKYCKARQPNCRECPVSSYCSSKNLGIKNDQASK